VPDTLAPAATGNVNIDGVVSAPVTAVLLGVAETVGVIVDVQVIPGVGV
jgi:hypothetical protein